MLFKFLKAMYATIDKRGAKFPGCCSTNTDKQGGIWYCYDCQKEW